MPLATSLGSLTRLNSNIRDLLISLFQLSQTEMTVFIILLKSKKPLSVDQISEKTKLDRTTVFRALQKLSREGREGLCYKENQPLPEQGYVHVYKSVSKEEFKLEIEKRIRFVQEGLERLLKKLDDDIDELLTK